MKKPNFYKIFDKYSPKKAKKYQYCICLKQPERYQSDEENDDVNNSLNIIDQKKIKRVYISQYSYSYRRTMRYMRKIYLKDMSETDVIFVAGMMNNSVYRIYRLKSELETGKLS